MPPEILTFIGMLLGGGLFTFLANVLAGRRQRATEQQTNNLGLATLNQTTETKFQEMVMAELKETRSDLKLTNEKIQAQSLQIAELSGKIKVLEGSESHLKLEVTRLTAENVLYKSKNSELNDENEIQGQEIAKLNGRLSVYEAQAALPRQP